LDKNNICNLEKNITQNNKIDKYIQRPKELENLSLLEFYKKYNSNFDKRKKEAIINVFPFIKKFD
jgi:hypothetical protein